jgi:hypothetical protein
MVLVHDNDLAQILGILGSEDTSLESLQLDALLSHLRIAKPKIYNISFGLGEFVVVITKFSISQRH